jgi:bifunctional UDP-N-acetylglucosamine pyrophosphorylase/glucosamine-1-phosphate N-acetyltransferase
MRSSLPKVVHPVGGRPMVCAVVEACLEAGCGRVVVVVGYMQELVREALEPSVSAARARGSSVEFAVQDRQLGTGHAVMCARDAFWRESSCPGHAVFVLCGDGPLIRSETLRGMLEVHRASGAAVTLATSVVDDPSGYGRIVRDERGRFAGIVEQRNATAEQLRIREVNPSYYVFDARALFELLGRVGRNEVTGEYYITDVPGLAVAEGRRVEVVRAVPPEDVLSINTPEDLARVDSIFRARAAGAGRGGGRLG